MPNVAVDSGYLTPGTYVAVAYGVGPSNAGGGRRAAIYAGAMATTGTATPGTKYKIKGTQHALELFDKSPLFSGLAAHFRCWRKGDVYAVAYAASSGGGDLATATAVITFSGTATGSGVATVVMFNEDRDVGVRSGQDADTVAANVAAGINGMNWLCTAEASGAVVTVSAPIPGISQNSIYRIIASITSGIGVTCAVTGTNDDKLDGGADGSTTELSNLSDVLDTLITGDEYYIGLTIKNGSTQNEALKELINNKLQASLSHRSVGFVAGVSHKSWMRYSATQVNFERFRLVTDVQSEYDPATLTGQVLAWTQANEEAERQVNMTSGFNLTSATWFLKPTRDHSARMDGNDINDLMTDGCLVIRSDGNKSFLNASLSTASKDPTGNFNDRRKWVSNVVSIGDDAADRIEIKSTNTYRGFNLEDDTYSGTTLTTKRRPRILTPSQFKNDVIVSVIQEMDDARMLAHIEDVILPSVHAAIDSNNSFRIEGGFDLRCVLPHMQTAIQINEVSPG